MNREPPVGSRRLRGTSDRWRGARCAVRAPSTWLGPEFRELATRSRVRPRRGPPGGDAIMIVARRGITYNLEASRELTQGPRPGRGEFPAPGRRGKEQPARPLRPPLSGTGSSLRYLMVAGLGPEQATTVVRGSIEGRGPVPSVQPLCMRIQGPRRHRDLPSFRMSARVVRRVQ